MPRPDDIGCIQLRDGQLTGSKGLAGGLRRNAWGCQRFRVSRRASCPRASSHHRHANDGTYQDMATVACTKSAPPGFLSAAVFLSSGKSESRRRWMTLQMVI